MNRLIASLVAGVAVIALGTGAVYLQGSQTPGELAPNTAGVVVTNAAGQAAVYGSTSCRLIHTGGAPNTSATAANTDQTPVATEVYIAEVYVDHPCTATGVAVYNGTAVSGNMKVGLATAGGVVTATSGSTAASGTSQYQRVPFTAVKLLTPGTYYVLTFYDNNTQRATAWTAGSFGTGVQTAQTYATGFTAITAPTTFTTAIGPVASLY